MPVTILIIGGYGFFGARIAATLAADPNILLLIGGRDAGKAGSFAVSIGLPETHAIAIDTFGGGLSQQLKELRVDLVIHAAGPFQGQGYHVARAAIAAGSHYADIADGRAFVNGIVELDPDARRSGVLVTSGASSVPALSAAVVDRYAGRFGRLDTVDVGISSSGRTPGLATMRGVFGYCGKPFPGLDNGTWRVRHGWTNMRRHFFPLPVGRRWLADCDVPDLELFPRRYPSLRSVSFKAGLASPLAHWAVWAGASLVRMRMAQSLAPAAPLLHRMSRIFEPLASSDSAMFVGLRGIDRDGASLDLCWHLIAEHGDGPFIPCGAAISLARKLARGDALPAAAMPCLGIVDLDDYLAALTGYAIRAVPP